VRRSSTTSYASSTSRARRLRSVDPTVGRLSEIYEWGPAVRPDELETLLDKLRYLSRVASFVVFSGSLPRDVEDDFYAEAIRDLNRRGCSASSTARASPYASASTQSRSSSRRTSARPRASSARSSPRTRTS